ncbi:Na+/H+ antiporter NhaA [Curtobacterium sp. SP.BCp]|jgi:hypothetical protein|uniref:Na+/H+ antiporter NhaA n=1 Tax=Curtobacterium sp. SP.BCp TaxID=3435230 RepID=UPI003F73BBF9
MPSTTQRLSRCRDPGRASDESADRTAALSLLVGELAYGDGSIHDDHAKVGILVGSFIAAGIGALILRRTKHTTASA